MELSNIPLATMIHNECELLLNIPIIIDVDYYKHYEGCYCLNQFFDCFDNSYQQKQRYYNIFKKFVLHHLYVNTFNINETPDLSKYQITNIEKFFEDPNLLVLQYNITYIPKSVFVICYYLIRIDEKIYDLCFYIDTKKQIDYTQHKFQTNWVLKYVKEIAYIK